MTMAIASSARNRILDAITENRVTIIIGGTGCGKSTLVPQLILDHLHPASMPILCTQPRRLAVVAVSTHVAKQRNTSLGNEVGYHVGQNRQANSRTNLLFATAGILLEELRSNGIEVLTKYKCVLIDECHERSAESDLCLAIIKSFMTKHPHEKIRIVLMSATFNHGKYTSYFTGVPGCESESIKTITLETMGSINQFYKQVDCLYLEEIMNIVPGSLRDAYLKPLMKRMRLDPDAELAGDDGGKTLSHNMVMLIIILVTALHNQEPAGSIFLIFAPTYRHLEQIYELLMDMNSRAFHLQIDVLHSSIDIEDCLKSMHASSKSVYREGRPRRLLLASAIADSSVTIPGVTCVIDTCRALEVRWDSEREIHIAKTVWASKSICDQRRGRTGRTCPGRVFRLVNQSFFINRLEDWDQPQIELASCRDEVLSLLSSTNKVVSNPEALLNRCMDPPPSASVKKAVKFLVNMGACKVEQVGRKERLVPTEYGKLLAALPFTINESSMVVRGARNGLLHEALVLVSVLSTRPHPILHVFGESDNNEDTLRLFYPEVNPKQSESVAVANVAAYLFWHVNWNIKIRRKQAKSRFLRCTGANPFFPPRNYENESVSNIFPSTVEAEDIDSHDCRVFEWFEETEEAHIRWCKMYSINPTSVRAIAASIDGALGSMYKKEHEPDWLRCQKSAPVWEQSGMMDVRFGNIFGAIYGEKKAEEICEKLLQLQDSSLDPLHVGVTMISQKASEKFACIHFLKGKCTFGARCKNAHSFSAPRPPCRFFRTIGCTNASCPYSHEKFPSPTLSMASNISLKNPEYSRYPGGALAWYKAKASNLLLFGEADFSFSKALIALDAKPLIATTYDSKDQDFLSQCYCDISELDATRCHMNENLTAFPTNHRVTGCAWNFPYTGEDENGSIHTSLLSGAFMSVAEYLRTNLSKGSESVGEFAVALQGDQFSRWSVLKSAQRAGFYLDWWDSFDHSLFPGYHPRRENGDIFPVQHARFYVFILV